MVESPFKFFYEALDSEKKAYHNLDRHQHLYLTTFLEKYMASEVYFVAAEEKLEKPTMAFLLKEAMEETKDIERLLKFKRLGDAALYTAGVFPLSIQRNLVGIDYFLDMGSNAYRQAYDLGSEEVFSKLSYNFKNLTDLLNLAVALKIKHLSTMEVFNMWSVTGSVGLYQKLLAEGLNPQSLNKVLS